MFLIIFFIFILLLIFDGIWLNLFMISKYKNMVKNIQKEYITIRFIPVILFYIIYSFSVYYLIFNSNLNKDPLQFFINGFILGICAYSTYDLTNLALFKNFDVKLAIVDILWGGFYTGLVCFIISKFMI